MKKTGEPAIRIAKKRDLKSLEVPRGQNNMTKTARVAEGTEGNET